MSQLATTRGKEYALQELTNRRKHNESVTKIENHRLPAGSPMYFYCISCDSLADVLPESYWASSPKKLCDECQALKDLNWLT